mgnify:CR=1 FL=1
MIYTKGDEKMNEITLNFANGFAITVFVEEGKKYLAITNSNGYVITDRKINDEEEKELVELLMR